MFVVQEFSLNNRVLPKTPNNVLYQTLDEDLMIVTPTFLHDILDRYWNIFQIHLQLHGAASEYHTCRKFKCSAILVLDFEMCS